MFEAENPANHTDRLLGRLEGRLSALEDRMDRSEASLAARLVAIEGKLDGMSQSLSQGLGGLRFVHWMIGSVIAGLGFLANHLWRAHE